jgi:hypothetical protein
MSSIHPTLHSLGTESVVEKPRKKECNIHLMIRRLTEKEEHFCEEA